MNQPNSPEETRGKGQPPKYSSPEELQEAVDKYFKECLELKRPPAVMRLAFALGFASRQSLYDYEQRGDFSYIIKRAKLCIGADLEERSIKTGSPGAIFNLKCNFGMQDKEVVPLLPPGGAQQKQINLSNLSEKELREYIKLHKKLTTDAEDGDYKEVEKLKLEGKKKS